MINALNFHLNLIMRAVIITSILLKVFGSALLIFEIFLKNDTMNIIERYINLLMAVVSVSSFIKPKFYLVHILHMIHFLFLVYQATEDLKRRLELMGEDEAKDMFMSFFLFFSSALNDWELCLKSGRKILITFKYFLINIAGFVIELISASLIGINAMIEKEEQEVEVQNKKEKTE